jgi:tetratricopeptide (TPR) repeat protein
MRICVIFALWVLITVSVVPGLGQTTVKATEYGPTSAFVVSVVPALGQTTAKATEYGQQIAGNFSHEGNRLIGQGKYEEAIKAFDEAIRLDPKYLNAWLNKGNALYLLGNHTEAIQSYDEAIKLGADLAYALCKNGNALSTQGKYDDAIEYYDEAIKQDPNDANAWHEKGLALDKLNKHDEAISSFKKANSSMFDIGEYYSKQNEYAVAIRYYDEAIKQDPKDEYAWYHKAMALRMLHRDSEAKVAYTKARELGYNGLMTQMEMTA